MKKKVCMIVQNPKVKGGIASVINGYRGSRLENDFNIIYVESYKDGSKIVKLIKAICAYIHFIKVICLDKPDFIHMHTSFGASFYRSLPFIWISNLANRPIINHCHGAEFNDFYIEASEIKKKIIYRAYNKCYKIIALSDEWKNNLSKIVPRDNIIVIENYSIISNNINKKKDKNVLFLGAIGSRKGCYDIPDVIEYVIKRIPSCKFIIAGDGETEKIKYIINKKGLEDNVILPGWITGDKKEKFLKESSVFFLPSYNEGMPMSILDAMGYALPIISTNIGGIPKIVHKGINGYLYNPGDIKGFAEGIIRILTNEDILEKFSYNSYNIAKNKYSLESHIEKLERLYEEI